MIPLPPYSLNRLGSGELHRLQYIVETLLKKHLSPHDFNLAKASMTGPYTQNLTLQEYNRLRSILQTWNNKLDLTASDLKMLRSTMGTSSAQHLSKSGHPQSTAAPLNTPFPASGSDRLRDIMSALRAKRLSVRELDELRLILTASEWGHPSQKPLSMLRQMILHSKGTQDLTISELNLLKMIMATHKTQDHPESNHLQSITAVPPNTPFPVSGSDPLRDVMAALRARHLSVPELDRLQALMAAPKKDHLNVHELYILREIRESGSTKHLNDGQLHHLRSMLAVPNPQQQSGSHYIQSKAFPTMAGLSNWEVYEERCLQSKKSKYDKITSATTSKVDKKKAKAKKPKKYDQVWDIKPRELSRLLYIKGILMGPPDAKGMISILDRLNIAIKGKEVTHVMFSDLLDDWNRAFRYLSDLDSELALREPLPDRESFEVGIDGGQYNWGNLVTTQEYFEDWESDF